MSGRTSTAGISVLRRRVAALFELGIARGGDGDGELGGGPFRFSASGWSTRSAMLTQPLSPSESPAVSSAPQYGHRIPRLQQDGRDARVSHHEPARGGSRLVISPEPACETGTLPLAGSHFVIALGHDSFDSGLARVTRGLPMGEAPLRVFISSTEKDLKAQRRAAKEVVLQLRWFPVMMEYFGPGVHLTVKECLDEIGRCDLVIWIAGYRYGWVPTAEVGGREGKSITMLEVEHARSRSIPIVHFLAEGWPV